MAQIYLVFEGDRDHRHLTAAFSSLRRAEKFSDVVCGEIEELTLNGQHPPPHPAKHFAWLVYIRADDRLAFPPDRISCRDFTEHVELHSDYEYAKVLCWARDCWHAEHIAKAWRMKIALMDKWHAGHGLDENIVLRAGEDF